MLEFELVLKEVEKLYQKERKSIRKRVHLENAMKELQEYLRLEQKERQ